MKGLPGVWERALLEQNRHWLTAYILAMTGDRTWTEDLVQEVFATALTNAARFDPSQSLGAWLRGIAKNLLLQHRSRRPMLSLDQGSMMHLDRAALEAEERDARPHLAESRLEALRSCLSTLTRHAREVLDLRYGARKPSREIADQLGMKATAVDMVTSRARKLLEECIARKMRPLARE